MCNYRGKVHSMRGCLPSRIARVVLPWLAGLWFCPIRICCQDSADQSTNTYGSRAEIAVTVRDGSGQVIAVPTTVKLYKNGAPDDQRSTSQGRAFLIPRSLGDFTIVVEAVG